MTMDEPNEHAEPQVAHALISQARAVVIYSDLLRQELADKELDRERLDRLASGIVDAAEQLAERVSRLAEESHKTSSIG